MTNDSEPDSLLGKLLDGRYLIIAKLKKGGFGETFLAIDFKAFKRLCVVKRFSFFDSDATVYESFKVRFALEAKALEDLGRNEQIPSLYGYFDSFFVQEFVVGKTLADIVSEQDRLPEKRVKEILVSLLTVLDFVHSKKKVHRDVTPKNIILRAKDGLPVLIDFGAVKELITGDLRITTIPLGTPGYFSPEQREGSTHCSNDLYSLGATALYLLTAKEPGFLNASRKGDGGWRKHAPEVGDSFAFIINKAMEPMAERYSSALEMRDELLRSSDDEPTKPLERRVPLFAMATDQEVFATKHPADFQLPLDHLYLGQGEQRGEHLLYRKRDRQIVLYLPKDSQTANSFIIDQHLVTNKQFALFLNDQKVAEHVRLTKSNDVVVATTVNGNLLVADAPSFWKRHSYEPLGKLAGLAHTNEGWIPLIGSERMPAVLVTVLGASWYAAWLKNLPVENAEIGFGLPNESQWVSASLLDENTGELRKFPWGNSWGRHRLNSLSYWGSRDLIEGEVEARSKATLTPVGQFPEGASASGLMDTFGNAWEWLKESDGAGCYMIRGGAYTSPTPVFDTPVMYRQNDFVGQAIGFRCAWYV
jgi:serine/threonine protein kinase